MKIYLSLILIFLPFSVMASDGDVFEARVIEIVNQQEVVRENGTVAVQQDVKLIGLENEWSDREVIVNGIGELEVVGGVVVKTGDRVIISVMQDFEGNEQYVITDHVRRGALFWLALLFAALIIIVGRWKGVKALISLAATFFVIMWFIVPQITHGANPLLISLIGSIVILSLIIYVTWGFCRKANIAWVSIFISLIVTGIFSLLFTSLTKLSGLADDNVLYLVGSPGLNINFEGLLLAGIIIGTLGVLDDVVISQISTVEQIKLANPNLKSVEVYKRSLKVGVDHISSMTNTLFLAYAGAALPLLLLFAVRQEPFETYSQIINHEIIATEIVRTLVGSVGLVLAVPIATGLAVYFLRVKKY